MRLSGNSDRSVRVHQALAVLALLGHLAVTFALPLPFACPKRHKGDGVPFPCQDRPCGCWTAEECWQGDCCCMTLAEKVAWADTHGYTPPPHVRPVVAAQQSQTAASCCAKACLDCPAAETKPADPCCEEPRGNPRVVGLFAQRCRGKGPAWWGKPDPSVSPDLTGSGWRGSGPSRLFPIPPRRLTSASERPPIPPPRSW